MLSEIDFEFRETILGSPALKLVPLAWTELLDSGYVDLFTVPVHEDYKAVIASYKGLPVAFILYEFVNKGLSVFINLSYVDPHFRRQGIYSEMFHQLSDKARQAGCLRVYSGVHPTNSLMTEACSATGRSRTAVFWKQDL